MSFRYLIELNLHSTNCESRQVFQHILNIEYYIVDKICISASTIHVFEWGRAHMMSFPALEKQEKVSGLWVQKWVLRQISCFSQMLFGEKKERKKLFLSPCFFLQWSHLLFCLSIISLSSVCQCHCPPQSLWCYCIVGFGMFVVQTNVSPMQHLLCNCGGKWAQLSLVFLQELDSRFWNEAQSHWFGPWHPSEDRCSRHLCSVKLPGFLQQYCQCVQLQQYPNHWSVWHIMI